jgi:hypothetical protein
MELDGADGLVVPGRAHDDWGFKEDLMENGVPARGVLDFDRNRPFWHADGEVGGTDRVRPTVVRNRQAECFKAARRDLRRCTLLCAATAEKQTAIPTTARWRDMVAGGWRELGMILLLKRLRLS